MEFGQLVKQKREEKGLSMQETAERASISASYISRLEKGERRTPSMPIIQGLVNALEISPEELNIVFGDKNNEISDFFETELEELAVVRLNNYLLNLRENDDGNRKLNVEQINEIFKLIDKVLMKITKNDVLSAINKEEGLETNG